MKTLIYAALPETLQDLLSNREFPASLRLQNR